MPEDKRFMSIDEHLKIIQEKYNHLAGRTEISGLTPLSLNIGSDPAKFLFL